MKRKALIIGITGQDGSYLAEFLLSKGYQVYGLLRRTSAENFERINHILDQIELVQGDLLDQASLFHIIKKTKPNEIYNLAAQSFIPTSFQQPISTAEYNALGAARAMEATRLVDPQIRFYQASTSEMFGQTDDRSQNEKTQIRPCNPYAAAKAYAHWMSLIYRNGYRMFICSGILFNHESPRRGMEFVSRKISSGVVKIKLGLMKNLKLGNLQSKRDWGFAGDYVKAMWMMLQQKKADDFVVATGKVHTVEDFVRVAFKRVDLDWRKYVQVDPRLARPIEVYNLCGDASKARRILGWKPQMTFEKLVRFMVDEDLKKFS